MIVNIDGRECACDKGEYLLDIALRNGIFIPTFCHHEGLRGMAACRICIVEIETEKGRQVVTSCVYPVEREMAVYTNSEKIRKQRRMLLSLLAARAPESALLADMLKFAGGAVPERFKRLYGEKCILCGRCVQACEKIGAGAISTSGRGTEKKVTTPYDSPSENCIGCASCAAVCPTGAIGVIEDDSAKTIWNKTFTLIKCEKCGVVLGSREELEHAAKKAGTAFTKLCESCRKKSLTNVLAETFRK